MQEVSGYGGRLQRAGMRWISCTPSSEKTWYRGVVAEIREMGGGGVDVRDERGRLALWYIR